MLIQIRTRSILDLLDLSMVVVRQRPLTLGLAALLGIAPFAAFNAWLLDGMPEDAGTFYAWTIWMIEAPFATAPLTVMLGGLMFGRPPNLGKIVGSLFRASFALLILHGFLRYFLFFFVPTRLAFANEVILLERGKWWKIVARGSDLASHRFADLVGLASIQIIVTYAFSLAFFRGITRIIEIYEGRPLTVWLFEDFDATSWRFQLPLWIATSFFAVTRFLTYIDQRIRLEGWEVELRLREVGEALEESRRW
jgi:hypothetical protein